MTSMTSKFEVARFDGTGNFGLWQTKVKDLLAQQSISRAVNEKKPARWMMISGRRCSANVCYYKAMSHISDHIPCHG